MSPPHDDQRNLKFRSSRRAERAGKTPEESPQAHTPSVSRRPRDRQPRSVDRLLGIVARSAKSPHARAAPGTWRSIVASHEDPGAGSPLSQEVACHSVAAFPQCGEHAPGTRQHDLLAPCPYQKLHPRSSFGRHTCQEYPWCDDSSSRTWCDDSSSRSIASLSTGGTPDSPPARPRKPGSSTAALSASGGAAAVFDQPRSGLLDHSPAPMESLDARARDRAARDRRPLAPAGIQAVLAMEEPKWQRWTAEDRPGDPSLG